MVGLPARGKSFISRKVERFLQWQGTPTRTFNVGLYRREAMVPEASGRSDFFDTGNQSALMIRERAALAALADSLAFLDNGGKVAILDATNTTISRRKLLVERITAHNANYTVLFVEAMCDDGELLDANLLGKVMHSPDFKGMSLEDGMRDLKKRIAKYEEVYETLQDDETPSIKLINLSSKVMANKCYGRITKSILPYLMAIHIGGRPIWLVRAGAGKSNPQSPDGDRLSKLSDAGQSFAMSLAVFIRERTERYWADSRQKPATTYVVTSTMPRAVESVCYVTQRHEQTSALNPVDKGAIGGGWWDVECKADMPPWEEFEKHHPDFFAAWKGDPLRSRFPGGESYMDVIKRLESVLLEVEMRTNPVLIVSHLTVLQLLVAYFRGVPIEEAWQIPFSKNMVMEVTPTSGGSFSCAEHSLDDTSAGAAAGVKRAAEDEPPPAALHRRTC